jgi:hypothetical protein
MAAAKAAKAAAQLPEAVVVLPGGKPAPSVPLPAGAAFLPVMLPIILPAATVALLTMPAGGTTNSAPADPPVGGTPGRRSTKALIGGLLGGGDLSTDATITDGSTGLLGIVTIGVLNPEALHTGTLSVYLSRAVTVSPHVHHWRGKTILLPHPGPHALCSSPSALATITGSHCTPFLWWHQGSRLISFFQFQVAGTKIP